MTIRTPLGDHLGIVLVDPATGLAYASSGGTLAVSVDNADVVAAINSQTGTLTALDPEGIIVNAPSGVTGTLVDIKRESDTGSIVGYTLFGTNTSYTPVGTLEPFVVAYGSVVVSQSTLPTGAATEALQNDIKAGIQALAGLSIPAWDTATPTFGATADTWVFKLSTVTVWTVTISYTDSTKLIVSSITQG